MVAFNDGPTMALAADKSLVHRRLIDAGVPVPDHVEARVPHLEMACNFVLGAASPCVAKPAEGTSGGAGVAGGVRSVDDLWRVCASGSRWGSRVLVERTVVGNEYRLLLLDGKLLDAVRRRPPTVTGDGRSTIGELIPPRTNGAPGRRTTTSSARSGWTWISSSHCGTRAVRSVPSPASASAVAIKTAVSENACDATTRRHTSCHRR